jgi:phenylalanyl-tRNA synthetase beta chain
MIVSWNWLKDYVDLKMSPDELAERLAMAGLNHESTEKIVPTDDLAIDLEITSNRPDCLGHLGIAREVAVLWRQSMCVPEVTLPTGKQKASDLIGVRIDAPELCRRYSARVIHGVKIGPSPAWLANRLKTIGITPISNVVDITNYVLMECGQPLHAFDYDALAGKQIIVRSAAKEEPFIAIDHRTYTLSQGMCVIADAKRPVALGGVMGGAETEVTDATRNVLIEAADFAPLAIRTASRSLRLRSDSSYRFERGVDPQGLDWASRRACQLILELAGGALADGVVDVHAVRAAEPEPVVLRFSQLSRVLGIEIPRDEVIRILQDLGMQQLAKDEASVTWQRPSWRRDLTREIDLVEEVARIHGYDQIPEDVGVPMVPSHRQDFHRVLTSVRHTLTASGFHEALTVSVVDEKSSECFSPWTQAPPIRSSMPMLRGADCLRRSLVPSLLESRRLNEAASNEVIELFETAKVYLPQQKGLPQEWWMLALTSGRSFREVKGVIEAILAALQIDLPLTAEPIKDAFLDSQQSCRLTLGDEILGILGLVSKQGRKLCGLRKATVVAELKLPVMTQLCQLIPQHRPLSEYPSIDYDFNFVVAERVRWAELEKSVKQAVGDLLERVQYQETYRDPDKDGPNTKRLLLSVRLRSLHETLSGEQADAVRQRIIHACQADHGAKLL